MRFGMNATEAEEAHAARSGGGYIRYLKDGENPMWILQDPDEWVYFYEHYNPGGHSFPCTQDDKCDGCNSGNKKMERPAMRVAFNVKQGDYVNAVKVPYAVSEKLKNRFSRRDTLKDREYIVTKYKVGEKVDYDVEDGDLGRVKVDKSEFNDIEAMLVESYEEAWGDADKSKATKRAAEDGAAEQELKDKLAKQVEDQPDAPPTEPSSEADEGEMVVGEADLRAMDVKALKIMCIEQYDKLPSATVVKQGSDAIVDWMMAQ